MARIKNKNRYKTSNIKIKPKVSTNLLFVFFFIPKMNSFNTLKTEKKNFPLQGSHFEQK